MDLGIIRKDHLIYMYEYLSLIKTFDIKRGNLLKLKKELIYDENLILGIYPCSLSKTSK